MLHPGDMNVDILIWKWFILPPLNKTNTSGRCITQCHVALISTQSPSEMCDPIGNIQAFKQHRAHTVLGCSGRHNNVPQTGWLQQQNCIFSQWWRLKAQDQGASVVGACLVRASPGLPARCHRAALWLCTDAVRPICQPAHHQLQLPPDLCKAVSLSELRGNPPKSLKNHFSKIQSLLQGQALAFWFFCWILNGRNLKHKFSNTWLQWNKVTVENSLYLTQQWEK